MQQESVIEDNLIQQLIHGKSQWTLREDLKDEDDLWDNFFKILTTHNLNALKDVPLTDNEKAVIKSKIVQTTFYKAAEWLAGANGEVRIQIQRDNTKLGIADYIVEQGTSGIWTYKKWNGGIVEVWAKVSTTQAIATALGNVYRAPNAVTTNFPFTITEPKVHLASQSGVVNVAYISELSNTSFSWYPIKYGKDSTSRVRTIAAYVNGKWK